MKVWVDMKVCITSSTPPCFLREPRCAFRRIANLLPVLSPSLTNPVLRKIIGHVLLFALRLTFSEEIDQPPIRAGRLLTPCVECVGLQLRVCDRLSSAHGISLYLSRPGGARTAVQRARWAFCRCFVLHIVRTVPPVHGRHTAGTQQAHSRYRRCSRERRPHKFRAHDRIVFRTMSRSPDE